MKRSRGKKDANQDELIDYARSNGAACIPVSQYGKLGFDFILLFRGVHLIEVKNPQRKWELTNEEIDMKIKCIETQTPYHVVEYKQHIADIMGIEYVEQMEMGGQ